MELSLDFDKVNSMEVGHMFDHSLGTTEKLTFQDCIEKCFVSMGYVPQSYKALCDRIDSIIEDLDKMGDSFAIGDAKRDLDYAYGIQLYRETITNCQKLVREHYLSS